MCPQLPGEKRGESPGITPPPPVTLYQLPPCNSHSDVLGTSGPGRDVRATGQGAGHRAGPPHLGKPGSQAPNQQHPRAGGCLARLRQSRSTKSLLGGGK